MKILKVLTSVALMMAIAVTPAFAFNIAKVKVKQHAAMHVIVMVERDQDGKVVRGGLCTAYAVGPHTLLTAQHCDAKSNAVYVDTNDKTAIKENRVMSYTITDKLYDGHDHMLLDVSGVYFKDTIQLSDHVRTPVQGEHTYTWGNPAGIRDQYREGVVTGVLPSLAHDNDGGDDDDEMKIPDAPLYLIQEPSVGGDSGEAIFGEHDGQLIGITTFGIFDGQFVGAYAIVFNQAQINQSLK